MRSMDLRLETNVPQDYKTGELFLGLQSVTLSGVSYDDIMSLYQEQKMLQWKVVYGPSTLSGRGFIRNVQLDFNYSILYSFELIGTTQVSV